MSALPDEEIDRPRAQHGPKHSPAYPMLAGSKMLVRRLQEKGASFETLRQLLLTQEVTVTESTLRKYCHGVLGKRPAAEVMPSRIGGRSGCAR
ncbi:MAG: hypothetical protein IT580_04070 [Verrucomicrobiales bacterium]|nr:hypothetical protein [Verrucomicrobiales bacterium]